MSNIKCLRTQFVRRFSIILHSTICSVRLEQHIILIVENIQMPRKHKNKVCNMLLLEWNNFDAVQWIYFSDHWSKKVLLWNFILLFFLRKSLIQFKRKLIGFLVSTFHKLLLYEQRVAHFVYILLIGLILNKITTAI